MRMSARGEVDPFIVMDVMEAARADGGARAVGDPHGGRPARHAGARRPRGPRWRGRWRRGRSATPWRSGCRSSARGSPGSIATGTGSISIPARVVVTAGSSAAFILAFTCLFERGERVAIGEPGYPSYRNILRALDLVPVGIATGPEDRFQPTPRDLTPDLAGVLVASPANPTGTMLAASELAALIGRAAELGLAFVSDEIYHGIQYGGRAVSRARDLGRGLRHQLVLEVLLDDRLADRLDGGARGARPPHRAAGAELLHLRAARQPGRGAGGARRDAEELERQPRGLSRQPRAACSKACRRPASAASRRRTAPSTSMPTSSEMTGDSRALAARILAEAGVAVTPGLDFDPRRGARHAALLLCRLDRRTSPRACGGSRPGRAA